MEWTWSQNKSRRIALKVEHGGRPKERIANQVAHVLNTVVAMQIIGWAASQSEDHGRQRELLYY